MPGGFYADESAIGYNAWCLAETGADEYGTPHPLFFRCFDNYHDPVMVYLLAPLVRWFGLSIALVRLPSALFHVAAAVAFYFLAREYVRNRWIALFGAALCATIPWLFTVSRFINAGYTPMVFGMVMGWVFLLKMLRRRSPACAVLAALSWTLAMYAHNIGRPMSALYLLCFGLVFHGALLRRWRLTLLFGTTLLLAMVPMMVSVASSSASLTTRFGTLAVWKDDPSFAVVAGRMLLRYTDYMGPVFLLMHGEGNLRHNTGISGELFIFMAPLVLAGLYAAIRHARRNPQYRLLLAFLLVYPAAAIVTIDRFHHGRCINGSVVWICLAVVGVRWLWLRRHAWKPARAVLAASLLFGIAESSRYFTDYFTRYPMRSGEAFIVPLTSALQYAFDRAPAGEPVQVSPTVFKFPVGQDFKPLYYTFICYFGHVAPATYQARGIPPERARIYRPDDEPRGLLVSRLPPDGAAELLYTSPVGYGAPISVYRLTPPGGAPNGKRP